MSDQKNNSLPIVIIIGFVLLSLSTIFGFTSFTKSYVVNEELKVNATNIPISDNGNLEIEVQDQYSRPLDVKMNIVLDSTSYSLASSPTINQYDLILNTTTGLSTGDTIAFGEQNGEPRLLFGEILSINGNTITLDSPVPYDFTPSKTNVFTYSEELTVDGSNNTVVFEILNFYDTPVDLVRMIFHCEDDSEGNDGDFCSADELERGIVLRKKNNDGTYINYWNVKKNSDWAELAYDTQYTDRGKPPSLTYTFNTRLTYGGQARHGVVIRLFPNESIQLLIQDDLTDITEADLMLQGHFVDY